MTRLAGVPSAEGTRFPGGSGRALPRLGFAGVGWIGRNRMRTLVKRGGAQAVAVHDPDPEAAVSACRLSGARAVPSFDALLREDLDGVVLATPNALHAEQAVAALDAGLAVFCQKPLGRDAGECARIVERARRADRLLGVDLSYRHTRGMQLVRRLVREGDIGEVYALELQFHNAYGPDKAWFYDRSLSGGGCLLDLGVHLVDLALWTLDFPVVEAASARLYAGGRTLDGRAAGHNGASAAAGGNGSSAPSEPSRTPALPPAALPPAALPPSGLPAGRAPPALPPVEDYATARLDLAGGPTASIVCGWKVGAGVDADIRITIHGSRGSLRMRNVNGSFYDFVTERLTGRERRVLLGPPDPWDTRAIMQWARRLREGRHFAEEARHYVEVAAVLDTLYRSALLGGAEAAPGASDGGPATARHPARRPAAPAGAAWAAPSGTRDASLPRGAPPVEAHGRGVRS